MILCIAEALPPAEVHALGTALEGVRFVDGRATAGWHARLVKHNLQADPADPKLAALQARIERALIAHPLFAMAVRPKRVRPIRFSRYEPGMGYGTHVDDAIMDGMRTDVSFTLFLSAPHSYDGGELVIESTAGEQGFKLPAGSLVLYPSTTLHRVEPVTGGSRLAAFGWARSLIRDPAARELLFDLATARQGLFDRHGKTAEFDLLSKCLSNLLRRWAED